MAVIDTTKETRNASVQHPAIFSSSTTHSTLDAEAAAGENGSEILDANQLEIVKIDEIRPLVRGRLAAEEGQGSPVVKRDQPVRVGQPDTDGRPIGEIAEAFLVF